MSSLRVGDLVTLNIHPSWIKQEASPLLVVVGVGKTVKLGKPTCVVLFPNGTVRTYFSRHVKKLP
jgi:hypothetical protein